MFTLELVLEVTGCAVLFSWVRLVNIVGVENMRVTVDARSLKCPFV